MQNKSMDNLIRYAVKERLRKREEELGVDRAMQYLEALRSSESKGHGELKLAAHSDNASKRQIEELGLKVLSKIGLSNENEC